MYIFYINFLDGKMNDTDRFYLNNNCFPSQFILKFTVQIFYNNNYY